jgi:hypothetical protein
MFQHPIAHQRTYIYSPFLAIKFAKHTSCIENSNVPEQKYQKIEYQIITDHCTHRCLNIQSWCTNKNNKKISSKKHDQSSALMSSASPPA